MAQGDELIKEYYDSLEVKPEMSYEQFVDVCKAPFKFLRRQISSDELPTIRFTFLGSFQVLPGMVIKMLQYTQDRFDKQLITEKEYQRYMTLLTNHIKRNREDFKKHELKLQRWTHYLS